MGSKRRVSDSAWFWRIIQSSRSKWDANAPNHYLTGNQAVQAEQLESLLGELSAGEVLEFDRHFSQLFWQAYRYDLWDLASIANGGCGDDAFMDFRYWLISMGRDVFEAALKDPVSATDVVDAPGVEFAAFEEFGYVADRVYEAKTSDQLPGFKAHWRDKPTGTRCADDAAKREAFPAFWATSWKPTDYVKRWDTIAKKNARTTPRRRSGFVVPHDENLVKGQAIPTMPDEYAGLFEPDPDLDPTRTA